MRDAELIEACGAGWKSKVRVSTIHGRLFLHSAFPTDRDDSVFLGPDSVRFADFLAAELADGAAARIVDIGAGAGVGGIVAAGLVPDAAVELVDLNPKALGLARINCAHAGVTRPPISATASRRSRPASTSRSPPPLHHRRGRPGLSRRRRHARRRDLARLDARRGAKLAPGGRLLLYTGSAIVAGRDLLSKRGRALPTRLHFPYREIDPTSSARSWTSPHIAMSSASPRSAAVVMKDAYAPLS